jgi:hypothetical protein
MPTWEEIAADKQDTYETAVVRHIANKIGQPIAGIKAADPAGEGGLTMEALHECVGLPVWLAARRIEKLDNLELDLEKRPTKTKVWQEFQDIFDDLPEEFHETQRVGLIFWWPRHGKYFILHNRSYEDAFGKWGRFLRLEGELHILEKLDFFLEALGPMEDWR